MTLFFPFSPLFFPFFFPLFSIFSLFFQFTEGRKVGSNRITEILAVLPSPSSRTTDIIEAFTETKQEQQTLRSEARSKLLAARLQQSQSLGKPALIIWGGKAGQRNNQAFSQKNILKEKALRLVTKAAEVFYPEWKRPLVVGSTATLYDR